MPTLKEIREYFDTTAPGYKAWGSLPEKEGIYALHCGFHPQGLESNHQESIRLMTQRVIDTAEINHGQIILDAGCGVGDITFDIAARNPTTIVVGITISEDQIYIASAYKKTHQIYNAHFSVMDFSALGFLENSFDRIIFCESFCYAPDKKLILKELSRVLRHNGSIVIADGFFTHEKLTQQEAKQYEVVRKGWLIPNFVSIELFTHWLKEAGFGSVKAENITRNILPSSERMMLNAVQRFSEETVMPDVIKNNREACIAQYNLAKDGTLTYYLISAQL